MLFIFYSQISESVLLRDDQKFDTCELQEGLAAQPMMGLIIVNETILFVVYHCEFQLHECHPDRY